MPNTTTAHPISEEEAVRFFLERDRFFVYTHQSPDGDTLGSAAALVLGLRQLGKTAYAWNRDGVPDKLSFLNAGDPFWPNGKPLPDGFVPVSVDVASQKMLAEEDRQTFALSIDHHTVCTVMCERLYRKETYPAAGEIVYELLNALHVRIGSEERDIAAALYAAISSDSGGFRYESTRPSTLRMAAALLETGIDCAQINRKLFECKPLSRVRLEGIAYTKVERFEDGKFAWVCLTKADFEAADATDEDADGLNDIPRQLAGVEISAVLRPKGNGYKCSFRSNGKADVAALALSLGGGGHKRASSFSRDPFTLAEMKALVLDAVRKCLRERS
ncbi:MAG: DHH family phosphoesterase [Clostridia bacterium]|nr:DHH family phosphoesterase [Clostridia bacterium]